MAFMLDNDLERSKMNKNNNTVWFMTRDQEMRKEWLADMSIKEKFKTKKSCSIEKKNIIYFGTKNYLSISDFLPLSP